MNEKSIRASDRLLIATFAILSFLAAKPTTAGLISFYTDFAAWEADALAAGLDITTETFETEPAFYPSFSVGSIDFESVSTRDSFDANNERIGFTSGGGRVLDLDYTGGSTALFGFGFNKGPTIGNMQVTDLDGVDASFSTVDGFIGVLGTVAFDPANPFPSDITKSGIPEYGTSGLALDVYIDNLSVATGAVVPLPPAFLLMGFGIGALVLAGRRKKQECGAEPAHRS